jgi:NitT/TauT family transport system substrate-binding protein
MILHGNSDATALPDPYLSIAIEKGAQKLICMSDLQLDVTAIVFLDKAIQDKQQPIQNFYHAYNQAVQFIQSNPDQLGDILVKDVGFSESNLQFLQMPRYQVAHMPTQQNMQITENWLRQKGILKQDFDVQSLLDDQFVQHNPNGSQYP